MGGTSTSHTIESGARTAAGLAAETNGKGSIDSLGCFPPLPIKKIKRTNYGLAFDEKEEGYMKELRLKLCGRGVVPDVGSGALSPRKIVCGFFSCGARKIG